MKSKNILYAALFGIVALFLLWGGYKIVTDRMTGDRWGKLLPEMQQKTLALMQAAAAAGLDVMFYDGWRSVEDEEAHIEAGTSKLTDPYNTRHLWGAAVDIVFRNAAGFPIWPGADDPRWLKLQKLGEGVGLVHPIIWDKPHFELPDFNLASVRKMYGEDFEAYLSDNGVAV